MTYPRRQGVRGPVAVVGLGLLAFVAVGAMTASPAQAENGGVPIRVEVIGPSPSPTPTASSSPTSVWPPRPTKRPTPPRTTPKPRPSAEPKPSVSPPPSPPGKQAEDEEISIRGLLFVSGLTARHLPSANPFGGALEVTFTVRNASNVPVSAAAEFWVTQPFGASIGEPVHVAVDALEPDESRAVSATISGMGQWTFVTSHMTFTPPEFIGKTEMSPLTRDTVVFFVPWWLTGFASLGITGAALWPRLWPVLRALSTPRPAIGAAL